MASPQGVSGDGDPADGRASRKASLDAWLDELDALHGPVAADAMADAQRWWATRFAARRDGTAPRGEGIDDDVPSQR